MTAADTGLRIPQGDRPAPTEGLPSVHGDRLFDGGVEQEATQESDAWPQQNCRAAAEKQLGFRNGTGEATYRSPVEPVSGCSRNVSSPGLRRGVQGHGGHAGLRARPAGSRPAPFPITAKGAGRLLRRDVRLAGGDDGGRCARLSTHYQQILNNRAVNVAEWEVPERRDEMSSWRPLRDNVGSEMRLLTVELRTLKDRTGLSLEALAKKTSCSTSSWSRYLNGQTLAPRDLVAALGVFADADQPRLMALWELADSCWYQQTPGEQKCADTNPGVSDGGSWRLVVVAGAVAAVFIGIAAYFCLRGRHRAGMTPHHPRVRRHA
ncbi:helix-turn-helix domain-containing protein [Nonomuraea sp. M3C6]|uniref:Helix-turn-helix domain-containing protein n=1 Tax=Nonomuraea marmarensis TaxID=3351344 RepID=A0ABW7AH53_9ACTN